MNKKECIDDLKYIRKALSEDVIYQDEAIIWIIDTLVRYFEKEEDRLSQELDYELEGMTDD